MIRNMFDLGNISLTVAWMIGSALVFVNKTRYDGLIFMLAGFLMILILRAVEYSFIEHMRWRFG